MIFLSLLPLKFRLKIVVFCKVFLGLPSSIDLALAVIEFTFPLYTFIAGKLAFKVKSRYAQPFQYCSLAQWNVASWPCLDKSVLEAVFGKSGLKRIKMGAQVAIFGFQNWHLSYLSYSLKDICSITSLILCDTLYKFLNCDVLWNIKIVMLPFGLLS